MARCNVSDVSRAFSNWRTCCSARLRCPISTVTSSRSSPLTQRGVRNSSHNARSPAPESTATNPRDLPGLSG